MTCNMCPLLSPSLTTWCPHCLVPGNLGSTWRTWRIKHDRWWVGGEEGLHEHGRGVHVVGEPLHQFDQGGPLYQRHPAVLLPFFEHDIVGRVVFRESAVENISIKLKNIC